MSTCRYCAELIRPQNQFWVTGTPDNRSPDIFVCQSPDSPDERHAPSHQP